MTCEHFHAWGEYQGIIISVWDLEDVKLLACHRHSISHGFFLSYTAYHEVIIIMADRDKVDAQILSSASEAENWRQIVRSIITPFTKASERDTHRETKWNYNDIVPRMVFGQSWLMELMMMVTMIEAPGADVQECLRIRIVLGNAMTLYKQLFQVRESTDSRIMVQFFINNALRISPTENRTVVWNPGLLGKRLAWWWFWCAFGVAPQPIEEIATHLSTDELMKIVCVPKQWLPMGAGDGQGGLCLPRAHYRGQRTVKMEENRGKNGTKEEREKAFKPRHS